MPRKKKEVTPVQKSQEELAKAIITPLYPAMLSKHEPAMVLIDLTLATYGPVKQAISERATSVDKADLKMSLTKLREAVQKYSDEKTQKDVLKKIEALEEVSIGEKK